MNTKLYVLFFLFLISLSNAQSKSTGIVPLGDGSMSVKIDLDTPNSKVKITLTGPATKWFALAFNVESMRDKTDCLLYDNTLQDASMVGGHAGPIADALDNWNLISDSVDANTRTVVAIRDFNSGDISDYIFTPTLNSLNIIWAFACDSPDAGFYHCDYFGVSALTFSNLGLNAFDTNLNGVLIYPNPTKEDINIEYNPNSRIDSIKIFATNAELLKNISVHQSNTPISIDTSDLKKGFYFMEISSANQKTVKKFEIY